MYQCVNNKNSILTASKTRLADCEGDLDHLARQSQELFDDHAGELVIKVVSVLERTDIRQFKAQSRGKADICLARQIAMYLMHTVFSCPYHRIAAYFNRDRTTISHACRLVEDLRDQEEFDKRLETMENLLTSARALYEICRKEDQNAR
jgi:chromosomal replication initiation ATPase DnaA